MPNDIYYPQLQEHNNAKNTQYFILNHPSTGRAIKIKIEDFFNTVGQLLPDQTNHAGEYLSTDGTNAYWTSASNILLVEITWNDLRALRNTNTLVPGVFYKITDRADAGIIIQATGINTLSLNGIGLFLNPDFQDLGDYSGLLTPKENNKGVWFLAGQSGGGAFTKSDTVFWNGLMYQVIDDSMFDTNSPDVNTDAYQVLTKSITNGYILEADTVMYDFDSDTFIERKDKLGNVICGSGVNFQWGNNAVSNNIDPFENFICINQRGNINENICYSASSVTFSELYNGSVINCYFGVNSYVEFKDTCQIEQCKYDNSSLIIFENNDTFTQKEIDKLHSTFDYDLDLSNSSIYASNKITIPTNLNYIGIFNLVNNNGKTFNKIANLSTVHKITRFIIAAGNNQTFSHTAVGVAVTDNLISDAATSNTIFGRANGNDFIEYERSGNFNIRTNIVKLA